MATNVNGTANAAASAGPPIGINPDAWVEPFETWPAEVIVSAYRECDEKYMVATEFRPALERPVWQWDLRVRRLDARFQLLDGSSADVVKYGGYDLERYNGRSGQIETINLRSNKEALISNAWIKAFTTIEPPEVLVGKKAMFEFYPSKRVGRNVAKNILIPVLALAPDYVFPGEVEIFVQKTPLDEGAAIGGSSTGATEAPAITTTEVLRTAEAISALVPFLNGVNRATIASIVPSLPANVRTGEVLQGLIDGSIVTQLSNEGRITVDAAGLITVADAVAATA